MGNTITIDEIKTLIKEEKIQPNILFGRDQLIEDPVIKGYVEEETKIAKSGEYAHRKREESAFDEKKADWEKQIKEKDEEINKLKIEGAKVKAADLFGTKAKERKLDDQQKKFIEAKQKDFSPEDLDNLDKDVDKFMDSKLEEFNETAKIFGHKTNTKAEPKGGGEPGDEPGDEGDASHIPD